MNERNVRGSTNTPIYTSGGVDRSKYSKDSSSSVIDKPSAMFYSRSSRTSPVNNYGDNSSSSRSSPNYNFHYSSNSTSSPVRSSLTKTNVNYLSSPPHIEKYASKSQSSTPSLNSSSGIYKTSTVRSSKSNLQSPTTPSPPFSRQAMYERNKTVLKPVENNKMQEESISNKSPIAFKRLEFSAMNRNAKFIDRCIIVASEKDYLTFGMKTSALSICLEMGIQLLHKVIDVMSLKKMSSSVIDEVLKIGSLQDPQQGFLGTEKHLQLNQRFKRAMTECYSVTLNTNEVEKTILVIEKIQQKRKKNVLTILQQNEVAITIFSVIEHEMEDVIHVIFDPSTKTTSGILHGASFLVVTGIGLSEFLNQWLIFKEEPIHCSFFIRNDNNIFKRFSIVEDEQDCKDFQSLTPPTNFGDEKKLNLELRNKLEYQRKIIERLEQEIKTKEASVEQEQAAHTIFLQQQQLLQNISQILKNVD
ncbi:hypothetical protein C9374_005500 [Naegleria lovaniensis]|uniref:Uncharacterized protein n=1 Tax=Naegleria lovaniensis TaxID=51637 RepID=A0AA88GPQ7_NAELO|nr:uncharacterized protein C9374_005500 [Naegleria lovaniensis]KAG2382298.1 hypothetical protein C9374_005500 [Naegleria lovaniensis]